MPRALLLLPLIALLGACGSAEGDGVVDVAIIGEGKLAEGGLRLDLAGQHLRAATAQGLVRLDQSGQVVPAIAERWIVTDDGTSYIFRIREFELPGGERLTAQAVRDSLRRTVDRLQGTSMGLDLANLRDIRAMTGRVVEIRLNSPMPGLLQLLAQPEMGIQLGGGAIGPMAGTREGGTVLLSAMPPEQRGLPRQPEWGRNMSEVGLSAVDARTATRGFASGRYDVVLGGSVVDLPLADAGPLSRGTIRLDSAIGLFGIDIRNDRGFLAETENREALSMALDRSALLQPFNIAGWLPTTRFVAAGLPGAEGTQGERWTELSIEQRSATAAARVRDWARRNGEVVLRIALPEGPGSDILLEGLAQQWGVLGIRLVRVTGGGQADLALRDRVARFGGAQWFLNQFHCSVSRAICSEDVDFLVELASDSADPAESASYLAEAESALTAFNPFIPIGAPIRWSMVRADVEGFAENPWGLHPLFPMSRAPI